MNAVFQGRDSARIAKVKRYPDFDKSENADGYEALCVKLASALNGIPNNKFIVLKSPKERALELAFCKELRTRQILCVIIDHYQIKKRDKDHRRLEQRHPSRIRCFRFHHQIG